MVQSFLNIILENNLENKINLYRFDYILVYIAIITDIIIKLLKFQIFKKKEKREEKRINIFSEEKPHEVLICYENNYLEIKNKSTIIQITMKTKKLSSNNNKIIEKLIKNNINNNITIIRNYLKIIISISIIINVFCHRKSNILFDIFYCQYSKITLKIKGIGEHNLFGNEIEENFTSINYLKEVKINGITENIITYKYYFTERDNEVELIWDDNIIDCGFMFWKCSDITEINLSKFNTKQVKAMNSMFAYCSSLTSLVLSNVETSNVIYMNWMFAYCSSLTSLVLSNFDTSKVTDMNDMFNHCSSLTSLDLSNFNTSQVNNTCYMFDGCSNLEYINLKKFSENKLNFYKDMFRNVPDNIVICIMESSANNKILSQIKSKGCYAIDCTNNWKSNQKKIINNNNQCIQSCDKNSQ